MNKSLFIKLDVILIVVGILLVFLNKMENLPSILVVLFLIIASLYFFPVKLILNNKEPYEVVSDLLISTTLIFAIVLKYTDFRYVAPILGLLNFGYIIYYVFFVLNKKNLGNIHRMVILSHFLVTSTIGINT